MSGSVTFAAGQRLFLDEGSAAFPSIAFVNDGVPDTGLYHARDGVFGVTCNGVVTVTFAQEATYFQAPAAGPSPAAGDNSLRFATTAWVTAAIGTASIGQIVMEARTSTRAGYVKCDGAQYKRADYPALWAYAQASGALVSEAEYAGADGAASRRRTGRRTSGFLICAASSCAAGRTDAATSTPAVRSARSRPARTRRTRMPRLRTRSTITGTRFGVRRTAGMITASIKRRMRTSRGPAPCRYRALRRAAVSGHTTGAFPPCGPTRGWPTSRLLGTARTITRSAWTAGEGTRTQSVFKPMAAPKRVRAMSHCWR